MKIHPIHRFKLIYLAFTIPFLLAFLSYTYFPNIAQAITTTALGYHTQAQTANAAWTLAIRFFYSWYTLLAIAIAGTWILAASFARKRRTEVKREFYPMVSFVVPAYNQEGNIARCVNSLFRCTTQYDGLCEIIVVDDGSTDCTYEVAWSTVKLKLDTHPHIRGKVVRHSANLGKIEALKTGVNRALGGLVAIVDADSEWQTDTLLRLVDYKMSNGKKAVTGYVHPDGPDSEGNLFVTLQQLEYSQGLGVGRCAQGLGDNVLVVSGAIGVYDAGLLRGILAECNVRTVTEDLEITLEMHREGAKVGYVGAVQSATVAPMGLRALWRQRLRWFTGWLHNTLGVHRGLMVRRNWLSVLLWYCYVFEFAGAFVDLAALGAFPFLWWFAPDRWLFAVNLLVFGVYGLLVGVVSMAFALRFAYGKVGYGGLLFYMPFYPLLRLVNVLARSGSVLSYLLGSNGKWHLGEQ